MPTKAVNIRMDMDLYNYLLARADKENRSLSNMIVTILSKEKEERYDGVQNMEKANGNI